MARILALLRRILVQDLAPVPDPDGGDDPEDDDPGQAVLELDQEVEVRQGVARDRVGGGRGPRDAPWAQVTEPTLMNRILHYESHA